MHREVLHAQPGEIVDHVNGDRLDQRRLNLRLASRSQNCANSTRRLPKSGYRGVYPHNQTLRWIAQISINGVVQHLGIFDDPQDAARAYDVAARRVFGAFARTNGFA